ASLSTTGTRMRSVAPRRGSRRCRSGRGSLESIARASSAGGRRRGRRSRRTKACCDNAAEMSRIAVVGAGYVGLTTAACLADLGNDVIVVDVNHEKIAQLQSRQVPFYEPGLSELVDRNARAGRLKFTTDYMDAIPGAEYAIIAVSTPEGEGGEADLSYVESAASSIADAMDG